MSDEVRPLHRSACTLQKDARGVNLGVSCGATGCSGVICTGLCSERLGVLCDSNRDVCAVLSARDAETLLETRWALEDAAVLREALQLVARGVSMPSCKQPEGKGRDLCNVNLEDGCDGFTLLPAGLTAAVAAAAAAAIAICNSGPCPEQLSMHTFVLHDGSATLGILAERFW